MAASLKDVKCVSAAVRRILMKFRMTMHISIPNLMRNQKFENPR